MSSTETLRQNTQSRAIPGFSVLKMKEEIQTKIYQDIKDMTSDELLAYFHKGSAEFRKEIASQRAKKTAGD